MHTNVNENTRCRTFKTRSDLQGRLVSGTNYDIMKCGERIVVLHEVNCACVRRAYVYELEGRNKPESLTISQEYIRQGYATMQWDCILRGDVTKELPPRQYNDESVC